MKFAAGLLALASADVKIIGGFTPTPNSEPYILSLQKVCSKKRLDCYLFQRQSVSILEWLPLLWCNYRFRHAISLRCSLLPAIWSHCCCRCSRYLKERVKPAEAKRHLLHQPRELQLQHPPERYCCSPALQILFEQQGRRSTTSRLVKQRTKSFCNGFS